MRAGGFHVVIGNPPYISALQLEKSGNVELKPYWKRKFKTAAGAFDIYVLFIERGASLLKKDGVLGFIVPNKFLAAEYAIQFRGWVLKHLSFTSLLDLSRVPIWPVSVYPVIPIFKKVAATDRDVVKVDLGNDEELRNISACASVQVGTLKKMPDYIWSFMCRPGAEVLLKVLDASVPLEAIAEVCGSSTVAEAAEFPKRITERPKELDRKAKFIVTGAIHAFRTTWNVEPITFTHEKYLRPFIQLSRPIPTRRIEQALTEKIVVAKVALHPRAFHDRNGEYLAAFGTYIFERDIPLALLVGLINSRLADFVYRAMYDALAMAGGYLRFQPPQLRRFPVPKNCTGRASMSETATRIAGIADRISAARQHEGVTLSSADQAVHKRRLAKLYSELNAAVYQLYGLTDADIAIVEGATLLQFDNHAVPAELG